MSTSTCSFWSSYWGLLTTETFGQHRYEVFGFENVSQDNQSKNHFVFSDSGSIWGFLHAGSLKVAVDSRIVEIIAGQWFCFPVIKSCSFTLGQCSMVFAMFSTNQSGLSSMGGPVETEGRLRYIDGCTDTLLYSPPVLGDPCLNLLHFPPGVDQTAHFHPSFRSGIVHRGKGVCVSDREDSLVEGIIFFLKENTRHKFRTGSELMDVISFHPDSDWGPEHEDHPMINRTWGTDGKTSS